MSIHLEWTTYGTIISCTVAHESSTKCILWILLCSSVPSPTLDTWIRNMKWISDVWRAHSKYEHKIRKLSEISASEAENYLGYQTVGTGWLHYTLYHTDSNAWIILFFVIYSSHARNSYSLEIILYIKPSSHHQHRHRHCRFHCYCHRHHIFLLPKSRASSYIAH